MAAMIRVVSASTSSPVNPSTGSPTRTRTSGGRAMLATFGTRALRGQTFSVPQIPIGITGAPLVAASLAAPQRPLSSGSKKARPRGIVPWGIIATSSPAASALAAAHSGSSDPLPRSTLMPPMALAICPTIGASKTSALPRNRSGRPLRATVTEMVAVSK